MANTDVISLRREYNALVLIADGIVDMIYQHSACNVLTFARMAQEARDAAHKIASMIERLLIGSPTYSPISMPMRENTVVVAISPPKRESTLKRIFGAVKDAILALVA